MFNELNAAIASDCSVEMMVVRSVDPQPPKHRVPGLDQDSGPAKTILQQQGVACLNSVKRTHFNVHTPLIDAVSEEGLHYYLVLVVFWANRAVCDDHQVMVVYLVVRYALRQISYHWMIVGREDDSCAEGRCWSVFAKRQIWDVEKRQDTVNHRICNNSTAVTALRESRYN